VRKILLILHLATLFLGYGLLAFSYVYLPRTTNRKPEDIFFVYGTLFFGLIALATGFTLLGWKLNGKENIAFAFTITISFLLLFLGIGF
jgi:hypothetical protein